MARPFVKSAIAAGLAAGLVLSATGTAFPAAKPGGRTSKLPVVKPVVLMNQGVTVAQGLKPKAALQMARRYVKYRVTTPHYIPKNFSLVAIVVYPYIPDSQPFSDTQYFYKAHVKAVTEFEVDHQLGSPFVYNDLGSSLKKTKVGSYGATIAEQKYTNFKTHKAVDLFYIFWYDKKTKLATEVTADLHTSGLSRNDLIKVAKSIS